MGGAFQTGIEARFRAKLGFLPERLQDLRLLAFADLNIGSGQRLPGDGVEVWLRERGLTLGGAAMLPLKIKRTRPLLLGPSLSLSLGQLRAMPITPDALSQPKAQLAAWLGLGAQARHRFQRVELFGELALSFPLHRLNVIPATGGPLRAQQVGLRLKLGVSLGI